MLFERNALLEHREGLEALCFKAGPNCARSVLIGPRSALTLAHAFAIEALVSDHVPEPLASASVAWTKFFPVSIESP